MDQVKSNDTIPSNKLENEGDSHTLFEKLKCLFLAKDDTSRFVGFALLKNILDNNLIIRDSVKLQALWDKIPVRFLDRLLRAQLNPNITKQEANNMADLAISVLHIFVNLLPENCLKEKRMTSRISSLLKALISSSTESAKLILQTIMTIVSNKEGCIELLNIQDLSSLIEIAPQNTLAINLFYCVWMNALAAKVTVDLVQQNIDKVMSSLVISFRGTDAVSLMNFVADSFPNLDPAALPQNPRWLGELVDLIRNLSTSRPTMAGRKAYTKLAAYLLSTWPQICTSLLFEDIVDDKSISKPFSYLFINLILIDLRSSFPTLLSELNTPNYDEKSQRLSAAFEIISGFVGFLIRSLDTPNQYRFGLAPDLLLKIRKDISETMSLTIEYLRDRWDASVAGAAGLHPSARTGRPDTRLEIAWDSIKDQVYCDPLVFSGIRTLAIWIRENENENLRCEAAGLMDMWVELYNVSGSEKKSFDFRCSIALALEAILSTFDGVDVFLNQDGWHLLGRDLDEIVHMAGNHGKIDADTLSAKASHGIQIVRVLLAVLDHPSTGFVEEAWMSITKSTIGIKVERAQIMPIVIEFYISMLQISVALLSKAANGMTKRYITTQAPLSGLLTQLECQVNKMRNKFDAAELRELLQDASAELASLRSGHESE